MAIPASTRRVPMHTAEEVNERIRMLTACRVAYFAEHTDEIADRLEELEREWDTERVLEANASSLALGTLVLGLTARRRRKLLVATGLIMGFLCQHALQGWCPPLPLLRRLGVRTRAEIDEERCALKAIRGDFADVPEGGDTGNIEQLMELVRR